MEQKRERKKVLIIEPWPPLREALKQFLERIVSEEIEVIISSIPEKGVESARKSRPCVIFCNMGRGGISGGWVITQLKKDPSTANIPIIAMSGDPSNREIALKKGAEFFIAKDPLTLWENVEKLIGTILSIKPRSL